MVAKHADVSECMVSYYLNKSRYVSPKLSARIQNAIDELNYHPDMVALSMRNKKSKSLTFVANDLANPMYGELAKYFEQSALRRGYVSYVCTGTLELSYYVNMAISRHVDGLYFASVPKKVTEEDIKRLRDEGIGVASGDYLLKGCNQINRIEINLSGAVEQAVNYLVSKGHRKIAFFNGFWPGYECDIRLESFRKCTAELGEAHCPVFYMKEKTENITVEQGYHFAEQVFSTCLPEQTAVLCSCDSLAFGVLNYCIDHGISVPGKISVMGIENAFGCELVRPRLTSVGFDRQQFAEAIVQILTTNIRDQKIRRQLIETQLVERESVREIPRE